MSIGIMPPAWISVQLEDIASDVSYGYTAKSTADNIGPHLLRITDIQNNRVDWEGVPFCQISESKKESYLLKSGDLVFARTGATVGKSFLIKGEIPESVYASYLIRVRCFGGGDIDYLSLFFNSPEYWNQITEFSAGIGQPNVNGTKLKGLTVPFPPLAEQQEITARLDVLLAQVGTLKARLDAIPAILKRFRQSVLAAAVSGVLTKEWRSEHAREWETTTLGSIIKAGPQNGIYKPSKLYGSGTKIIRIDGFYDGEMTAWEGIKRVRLEEQEILKWQLNVSDILINRVNSIEYLGKCALVRELPETAVFESNIMRITLDTGKAFPEYVALFLTSLTGLERLRENAKLAVNQASINQGDVKGCLIELPKLDEQTEIVRRVEQLFAFADQIEQRVKDAQARVNHLTQSILAKAFRGELTAEWREQNPDLISGENSAEALLARIQVERAAAKPAKRGRRKATA